MARAPLTWADALALLAFAISLVTCVWILVPHGEVTFTVSGSTVYREQFGEPLEEVHRRLAYWCDGFRERNRRTFARLVVAFRLAALSVIFQTGFWVLQLVHLHV